VIGDAGRPSRTANVVEHVLGTVAKWRTFAAEARVPDATADEIAADIDTWSRPLLA